MAFVRRKRLKCNLLRVPEHHNPFVLFRNIHNCHLLCLWRFLTTLRFLSLYFLSVLFQTHQKTQNSEGIQRRKYTVTKERRGMDEDRIGLVLVRVAELRAKITNCIQKAANEGKRVVGESQNKDSERSSETQEHQVEDDDDDDDEETQTLLNIGEALESLEAQLSSLQALQQQQWYEKEVGLAEIRYSQKKLLEKLKEYKGEELGVIHEAIAFAGETVEDSSDLLLPPYPSRRLHSVVSDNNYLSQFPNARKISQNGVTSGGPLSVSAKGSLESDTDQHKPESRRPLSRVKVLVGAVAKAAIAIVGVISVLSLAGYEPSLRKRDNQFKVLHLFQQQGNGKSGVFGVECPPGKVPVVENGETRCLVKERVEIPFESVVATPDVNYGCG